MKDENFKRIDALIYKLTKYHNKCTKDKRDKDAKVIDSVIKKLILIADTEDNDDEPKYPSSIYY